MVLYCVKIVNSRNAGKFFFVESCVDTSIEVSLLGVVPLHAYHDG
jgi:hypothetical protein